VPQDAAVGIVNLHDFFSLSDFAHDLSHISEIVKDCTDLARKLPIARAINQKETPCAFTTTATAM
jgi:hypothetical protein